MRFKKGKKNGKQAAEAHAASVPMKSWLDLIPLSERVHRKQSRMTRICIVLAVALVMTIFGMADMEIRNQIRQARMSDGVETSVIGTEEALTRMFPTAEILEGTFPEKENEAVFSENARQRLGLSIGDQVTLDTPWGERVSLTVSGFCGQFSQLNRQDAFGVFLNMDSFRRLAEAAGDGEEAYWNSIYMVAFSPYCNIQ